MSILVRKTNKQMGSLKSFRTTQQKQKLPQVSKYRYTSTKFHPLKTEPDFINDCVKFFTIRTLQGIDDNIDNNQDCIFYSTNYNDNEDQYLFGICDGHGPDGHLVSNYVAHQYKRKLRISLFFGDHQSQNIKLMNQCTIDIEKEMQFNDEFNLMLSGTTLITIFINGDKIICQNIGNSKAVFFSKSLQQWQHKELSQEHKLSHNQECFRILKSGGQIRQLRNEFTNKRQGPYYVFLQDQNIPQLYSTRSLGDSIGKKIGVTSESEFQTFQIKQEGFLIIGTCGLWDVMSYQEIIAQLDQIRLITQQKQIEELANSILNYCKRKWETYYNNNEVIKIEDISFILIYLS
ncbi:unnamed protein product [Paramecium primaurelia]|uniref:PPM-type phosphatase domain-containing protein n=2 Tax=Paramecium TaxID=5884 RepID=A0A8S1SSL0_9CILI|nr:unnamed protein product [Paramecium primaurelia]CAD8142898.1 unnamed protein product [Paramecium pentaurelia]